MKKKFTGKVLLFVLACILIFYGFLHNKRCNFVENIDETIKMGRYQEALSMITELENSSIYRFATQKDPVVSYNKGVLYALMEDHRKASKEFRIAMDTDDPVLKAKAIYNNANLLATDMDFSTAALQYTEVLKINENDFQAKKNLERMKIGEAQFQSMFRLEQKEREDRIEALKLIPWGTKYRYSGEQKIRW